MIFTVEDTRDGWNAETWPKASGAEGFNSVIEDDKCVPNPAPVWSVDGEKIAPADYERALKNAIVEVWFSLEQCVVKDKSVYTPVLFHLRVLKEPPSREAPRYLETADFEGGSPKKKRKRATGSKK
jgi:hypothetical protein